MILIYLKYFFKCFRNRANKKFSSHTNSAIKVLNTIKKTKKNEKIEIIRYKLLKNNNIIKTTDFGAGSKRKKNEYRKISYIAKYSLTKTGYCVLLRELAAIINAKSILEFGTSLGITAMYLKSAKSNPELITVEADREIAKIAAENFVSSGYNIKIENQTFDDFLENSDFFDRNYDMIFIDGNHRKDATVKYFCTLQKQLSDNGIIVLDDIRWSKDMFCAWKEIISTTSKGIFLDLFKMGIYFNANAGDKKYFCKFFI